MNPRSLSAIMLDTSKPLINLFRGWPNPSFHAPVALHRASSTVLSNPSLSAPALGYGPDEGYSPLRSEIAKWLTDFYAPRDRVVKERICITGGASQNLACLLQVFSDAVYTRNIWMVAPTYYLACGIFDDAGFAGKLRGVPEDEEGVDIGFLDEQMGLSERRASEMGNVKPMLKSPKPYRKIYKHIIYATPTFSNPSTKIMSLRRREQLIRLARKHDALIVTDDVYDHLQWSSSPVQGPLPAPDKAVLPRIVDIDRFLDGGPQDEFGNAVSNGSFSKLIGAGCRVGWAEGTEKFAYGVSQVGSSRSGGAPSQLTSTFVCQLLANKFLQSHILNVLQPGYAKRYHALVSAIQHHLVPLGVTFAVPTGDVAGGYFLWLGLPAGLRAKDLALKAQAEENLVIAGGNLFKVDGDNKEDKDGFQGFIRICFAWEEVKRFDEGLARLAELIRRELGKRE